MIPELSLFDTFLELLLNLTLLVALTVISGFIETRRPLRPRIGLVAQGVLFGLASILGMLRPLDLGSGLIFDGRSVMIGLCALYFGPLPTLVAALPLAGCRLLLGGSGALTGVLVILSSAVIGLLAHARLTARARTPSSIHLYFLGFVIHLAMLLLMFTLPHGAGWGVVQRIGLPVLLLYPLAMVLGGKILSDQFDARRVILRLRESEEKHRILLEESPDPTFSFTPEGEYLYVNPAFAKGVGKPVDQIIGRRIWDVFPKEEADKRFAALSHSFRTGEVKVFEVRVPRPDGDRFYVTTITPIKNPEGVVVSAICSSKEITERRQAEEALKQSEARLRVFAETVPVGIILSDREEKTLYVSPMFVKMFGYTLEEIPSVEAWWSLAYPDEPTRERARSAWATLMEQSRQNPSVVGPLEFPVVSKDGARRHIEFRLAATGELNVVVLVDVTPRRQAQEEQAKSHHLLESLARLVPGVIYQYRLYPDGRSAFPWSSPGMNMIYEVTPEEVREDATPVFGRLHPEDRERVTEAIFESARTLQTFFCEFRVILPRQGLRWRWSQAHPERMEDGGTLWHGIISDTTELKQAQEERIRLETQLQQAMKMEAIGRLAGGVAHDFNNLLTGIIGNIELTQIDLAPDDPIGDTLSEIGKAAQSAASLTRQLLAFSRKQLIEPKVLDLNEIITTLHKMLVRLIGEDIELQILLGQPLRAVKVDPGQFEQILVNLAVNARDAMPNGGKLIIETADADLDEEYVQRHPDARAGAWVRFAVSDTGIGMSEAVKSHLFEPFFTTKPKGRGTGLGLATIYGAVKQSGGFVEVYSEENRGTTFKIYLPSVSQKAERVDLDRTAAEMPVGTETILLVEDEEIVLKLALRILTRLGYRVLHARDGAEAMRRAEEYRERIDLLLTDVVMPGINGHQLAERLIRIHPETKVLYSSGYTENAIAHHGIIDEGLNFIGKPYSPQSLAKKLREVLGPSLPPPT